MIAFVGSFSFFIFLYLRNIPLLASPSTAAAVGFVAFAAINKRTKDTRSPLSR